MRNTLIIGLCLIAGSLVGWGIWTIVNISNCSSSYNQMKATLRCIETPGCVYLADDLFKAQEAAVYYAHNCKEFELRRQLGNKTAK